MIFLLGYLMVGCITNLTILIHDYFTRNNNIEAYDRSYGNTRTNILAVIVNVALWPVSVVSIILYSTNPTARKWYNEIIDKMESKDNNSQV